MSIRCETQRPKSWAAALGLVAFAACGDGDRLPAGANPSAPPAPAAPAGDPTGAGTTPKYVLASIVLSPDGNDRTTFLQTIPSLDAGPFTNKAGIEIAGNAAFITGDRKLFVAYEQEPTWERFELDEQGQLKSTGRLSLQATGAASPGYASAYVDAETAVTILTTQFSALVWNPTTMTIKGEIDLSHLKRDGFELEGWTTVAHQGRVYIPARWQDWDAQLQIAGTSLTILDPKEMRVVGVAEDARCTSGGQPVFDDEGYAYVMADGRTYSDKTFALAQGKPPPPDHCILRIAPGQTDFDPDYYVTVPSLTGGLDSITELQAARQGSGVGFVKVFDPGKLPAGMQPNSYAFWSVPAHRLYRFTLGDQPKAEPVSGLEYSAVGFTPVSLNGRFYSGESPDNSYTDVYEVDPEANTGVNRFRVEGQFLGLFDLSK